MQIVGVLCLILCCIKFAQVFLNMKKILFPVVFFLLISLGIKAQQQLFIGVQSTWGGGLTSIENKGNVLKSKIIPWQINTGLTLQYRIAKAFSIEGGIAIDNLIWNVYDKDFKARYAKRFEINMKNKIGSPSFFINLQYAFLLPETDFNTGNYIYIQLGGGYHKYGKQLLTQEKNLVLNGNIVEAAKMQTHYDNAGAYFISPEIGFLKLNKISMFSVGIVGAFNLKNTMFTSNYTITKADGTPISSDKLTASGSYIGLNLKVGVSVFFKEKKEKEKKEKEEKEEKVKTPKVKTPRVKKERKKKNKEEEPTEKVKTVTPTPSVETNHNKPVKDTVKKTVNGRDYAVGHTVTVKSKYIKIIVWDNEQVDGDRINLSLNGTWILENYTLVKKQKIIEVELKEGVNHLVLYALNLGDIPPNTAAIMVNDNDKLQEILLESTMQNSGALEIIYNP